MQTIIGIVICLIVIIIFSVELMGSHYEGLTSGATKTAPKKSVTTSPSGEIPLKTVVENANQAAIAKETTIGLSQNKDQYQELINHLLDYYDNRIIYEITNAKQDDNGDYKLESILTLKNIKNALLESLEYVS